MFGPLHSLRRYCTFLSRPMPCLLHFWTVLSVTIPSSHHLIHSYQSHTFSSLSSHHPSLQHIILSTPITHIFPSVSSHYSSLHYILFTPITPILPHNTHFTSSYHSALPHIFLSIPITHTLNHDNPFLSVIIYSIMRYPYLHPSFLYVLMFFFSSFTPSYPRLSLLIIRIIFLQSSLTIYSLRHLSSHFLSLYLLTPFPLTLSSSL